MQNFLIVSRLYEEGGFGKYIIRLGIIYKNGIFLKPDVLVAFVIVDTDLFSDPPFN